MIKQVCKVFRPHELSSGRSSNDKNFIHLSLAHQLPRIFTKFFKEPDSDKMDIAFYDIDDLKPFIKWETKSHFLNYKFEFQKDSPNFKRFEPPCSSNEFEPSWGSPDPNGFEPVCYTKNKNVLWLNNEKLFYQSLITYDLYEYKETIDDILNPIPPHFSYMYLGEIYIFPHYYADKLPEPKKIITMF
jgi:hypothetical protein